MHALVEQPERAEVGRRLGDDDRASRRQLGGLAAASLAERIATGRSEALGRPCLDVGWKRGTLAALYFCRKSGQIRGRPRLRTSDESSVRIGLRSDLELTTKPVLSSPELEVTTKPVSEKLAVLE
eukprot:7382856-Prymnesium_polylepis.1